VFKEDELLAIRYSLEEHRLKNLKEVDGKWCWGRKLRKTASAETGIVLALSSPQVSLVATLKTTLETNPGNEN
jgi:hypothetical protein